jgi:hypothetical protein
MATFKWEQTANRVIVAPVGYDEAGGLIKLPSRRWRKERNEYVVPLTRMNCVQLMEGRLRNQMPEDLRQHMERIAHPTMLVRAFPNWFTFKMQPFFDQRAAIDKLYPMNCGALLMPMGVGKSKAFIDIVTAHFFEQRIRAVVLEAPLTTLGVWSGIGGQLEKHSSAPYRVVRADSSFDWTQHRPKADELLWILVGLESLSAGKCAEKLLPFIENNECAIGCDESHWIKNHAAIRTKNSISLRQQAQLAYILTGTLATRNIIDLYAQYEYLDPNIIGVGDYYAFRNRYCIMGGYKRKDIIGYDNVEELMGLIEPYTYICDVPKGLPPQIWMPPRQIPMHPEQWDMYQKVKRAEIDGVSVKLVLTRVLRLQQICGGFLFEDGKDVIDPKTGKTKRIPGNMIWQLPPDKNPKLKEVIDVIEQEPDEVFIVWAKYIPEIRMISETLSKMGKKTAVMIGATENRDEMVNDFQTGKYACMVANQQTGGISWTMTRATRSHYYSNTDRLDDRLQSEKRPHRQGQDRPVVYSDYEMRTPNGGLTADSAILASIADKKDLDQWIKDKIKEAGFGGDVLDKILGG